MVLRQTFKSSRVHRSILSLQWIGLALSFAVTLAASAAAEDTQVPSCSSEAASLGCSVNGSSALQAGSWRAQVSKPGTHKDKDKRFIFQHIGKAGGGSIDAWMA
eukprot:CAMPEP_0115527738 /NCGR_PEP_ID=MMETSP0271-20121206/83008_1 /TAXON_ID=71861 /ORGANISM="Scrippsiella trochoidea, Strain CCMP3099" /LENGTH=103 /DNA_ID=CAMNT_0002959593 /DNA_START=21 /DNA_END=329 /DNA_ORIENTATION=-